MSQKLNFILPNRQNIKHTGLNPYELERFLKLLRARNVFRIKKESEPGTGAALIIRGTLLECVTVSSGAEYELRYEGQTLVTRKIDPVNGFNTYRYNWENLNKLPECLIDRNYNSEDYKAGYKQSADQAFAQLKRAYDSQKVKYLGQFNRQHKSLFTLAKQTYCFFSPRTLIKGMSSLGQVVQHAFSANNRSREAFTALGWIKPRFFFWTSFTDKAPQILQTAYAEQNGNAWINNYEQLVALLATAVNKPSPERKFFEEIGWMKNEYITDCVPEIVKAHFDYRYDFEPEPAVSVKGCGFTPR